MQHVLYRTADPDAPGAIKDRNGEVVLDCCRTCGLGESELDDTPECTGQSREELAARRRRALAALPRADADLL